MAPADAGATPICPALAAPGDSVHLFAVDPPPGDDIGSVFAAVFPGVLLHELSHFVMARLLRVRTGRFSLLPSLMEDGKLRLGFVETDETDLLREALIGTAPLITGGAAVAYLGISRLGLVPLAAFVEHG